MSPVERIVLLEANLSRQLQWIASADAKSNFIFTISIAMLGVLAAVAPTDTTIWDFWPAVASALALMLIVGAIFCAAHTVFPRTDGPENSLIYCGGIAKAGLKDFRNRISCVSHVDYAEDLIVQCFTNASIANKKFCWVKRGLSFLYASAVPWALATWYLY